MAQVSALESPGWPVPCAGRSILFITLAAPVAIRSDRALGDLPPETPRRQSMADNQSATRGSDKRKQSLYFPEAMLQEIKDEAARLDRSLSWVVQRAWKMARLEIKKIPSVNEVDEENAGASGLDSKI